jgi:hypothetical protein
MTMGIENRLRRLARRARSWVPEDQRTDLRHLIGRYRPWEEGVDLTAPVSGPGEVVGPPGFVGIGAELAGSQWWYRLVADHPEVWSRGDLPMARHYLTHFCTRGFGQAEIRGYHRWFPRPEGWVTGEWTPSYLAYPWVAPLLARSAPEARLLVIVRDPVERLLLGAAHTAGARVPNAGSHSADAVDRGFYGAQVGRILEYFPLEQVHVVQYEQCRVDPARHLAKAYRFLGLADGHRPTTLRPPAPRPSLLSTLDSGTADRLADIYADDARQLADLVPDLDLSLWPGIRRP